MMSRLLDERTARRRRMTLYGMIFILAGSVLLPVSSYLFAPAMTTAQAATEEATNPRANYWRAVREGISGYTAVEGQETDVLIQNGGQNWRQVRNGPVAGISPWPFAIVVLLIGLFHVLRGPVKLEKPRSGKTLERWTLSDRVIHWYTAVLFIVMALTGFSLLFGRSVLIPVMGLNGFAVYADVAKALHNYLGPFFAVGVLVEIISWMKYNLPGRADWEWIKKLGGMIGRPVHVRAGRLNGGEKGWYWLLATVGVAVVVTGLIMDFPNFGQTRGTMQIANLVHAILAVIWASVALGHIYLGTIGSEGSLEGMTTGRVSIEWADQHHDDWCKEQLARQGGDAERGKGEASEAGRPAPGGASR